MLWSQWTVLSQIFTCFLINAWFPPFRCRSSVAVSPFCRCKIPLFCNSYVRTFCSVTAVNSKKIRYGSGNGNGNGVRKRRNGNRRTATEWWKPGIISKDPGVHATAVTASQSMPAAQLSVRTMASCYNCCAHSLLGP